MALASIRTTPTAGQSPWTTMNSPIRTFTAEPPPAQKRGLRELKIVWKIQIMFTRVFLPGSWKGTLRPKICMQRMGFRAVSFPTNGNLHGNRREFVRRVRS